MVQRDARVIAAIRRMSELAEEGRRCIAGGSVEGLGPMMGENWRLQQELDPSCSTPEVDALFRAAEPWACGAKLVGAGGGVLQSCWGNPRRTQGKSRPWWGG